MILIGLKNCLSGFSLAFCLLVLYLGGTTWVQAESVLIEKIKEEKVEVEQTTGKKVTVEIKKFAFIPEELTVPIGTTVRWINAEKRQYHSVWFESLDKEEADYFFPDETYEKTFTKPGIYHYRCGPHERMKGTVVVTVE